MYRPNFKSVALSVPEIMGGTLKHWAVSGYAHAPFSAKFLMGLRSDGWTLRMCGPNLKSLALPVPEIIAIEVLGVYCDPSIQWRF